MIMRTLAVLLILVAVAASQPYHWLGVALAALARFLGG
jgi:hypothetical protein